MTSADSLKSNHSADRSESLDSIEHWRHSVAQFRDQLLREIDHVSRAMTDVQRESVDRINLMRPSQATRPASPTPTQSPSSSSVSNHSAVVPPSPMVATPATPATQRLPTHPNDIAATKNGQALNSKLDDSQDRLANLKRQLAAKLSGQAVAGAHGDPS